MWHLYLIADVVLNSSFELNNETKLNMKLWYAKLDCDCQSVTSSSSLLDYTDGAYEWLELVSFLALMLAGTDLQYLQWCKTEYLHN